MSLPDDVAQNVLRHCLAHPNFRMRYSYAQRPGAAPDEDLLRDLLRRNPEVFLERYGPLLNGPLLEALNRWYPDHYEVQHYLAQARRLQGSPRKSADSVVRNRRYRKMLLMRASGEYFGLYEMQRRRPLLFYQYVGRYKGTFECDRQGGMVDRLVEDLEAEEMQRCLEKERAADVGDPDASSPPLRRPTGREPTRVPGAVDLLNSPGERPPAGKSLANGADPGRAPQPPAPAAHSWPRAPLLTPPPRLAPHVHLRPAPTRTPNPPAPPTAPSPLSPFDSPAEGVGRAKRILRFGASLPTVMDVGLAPARPAPAAARRLSSARRAAHARQVDAAFKGLNVGPTGTVRAVEGKGVESIGTVGGGAWSERDDEPGWHHVAECSANSAPTLWGEVPAQRPPQAPTVPRSASPRHVGAAAESARMGDEEMDDSEEEEEEEEEEEDAEEEEEEEELQKAPETAMHRRRTDPDPLPGATAARPPTDELVAEQERLAQLSGRRLRYQAPDEEIDEGEMALLLQQFTAIMEGCFLDGEDANWVDYHKIDNDASLDDVEQLNADAEDRYFDSEEPSDVPAPRRDLPPPRTPPPDETEFNESNNWGF
eukprot:EG_transcript_5710